jgi:hypothetical protein
MLKFWYTFLRNPHVSSRRKKDIYSELNSGIFSDTDLKIYEKRQGKNPGLMARAENTSSSQ